jgi:pyruvate/2-oxoglutarate dehydrogenase complex dihydrolipoamide acyltransferase (E2) component
MAEQAPQRSFQERQHDKLQFALAIIGRKVLDFAQQRGFQTWDDFEKLLAEAYPLKEPSAEAPASPEADPTEPPGAPPPVFGPSLSGGAPPATRPGPPPPFTKAARAAMEANGVDEQLLLIFLGNRGTGPGDKVTPADVERYLNG